MDLMCIGVGFTRLFEYFIEIFAWTKQEAFVRTKTFQGHFELFNNNLKAKTSLFYKFPLCTSSGGPFLRPRCTHLEESKVFTWTDPITWQTPLHLWVVHDHRPVCPHVHVLHFTFIFSPILYSLLSWVQGHILDSTQKVSFGKFL